jgi:hypothetical protein
MRPLAAVGLCPGAARLKASMPTERRVAVVGAILPEQLRGQILEAVGLVTHHHPQSVPGLQRAGLEHFGRKSAIRSSPSAAVIPTQLTPLSGDSARWGAKDTLNLRIALLMLFYVRRLPTYD